MHESRSAEGGRCVDCGLRVVKISSAGGEARWLLIKARGAARAQQQLHREAVRSQRRVACVRGRTDVLSFHSCIFDSRDCCRMETWVGGGIRTRIEQDENHVRSISTEQQHHTTRQASHGAAERHPAQRGNAKAAQSPRKARASLIAYRASLACSSYAARRHARTSSLWCGGVPSRNCSSVGRVSGSGPSRGTHGQMPPSADSSSSRSREPFGGRGGQVPRAGRPPGLLESPPPFTSLPFSSRRRTSSRAPSLRSGKRACGGKRERKK